MKESSRSAISVFVIWSYCESFRDVMKASMAWRRFCPGHVLDKACRILSRG